MKQLGAGMVVVGLVGLAIGIYLQFTAMASLSGQALTAGAVALVLGVILYVSVALIRR